MHNGWMVWGLVCAALLCAGLLFWLVHLKIQIAWLSRQLDARLNERRRNSVSVALVDPDIIRLAARMNRCFELDEANRLALSRQEKDFRRTIADISHDLRTPLTSVKGYLQLLAATGLNASQRDRMNVIQRHVTELGDLIEHFFEYSYLLSDESELFPETFSLTDEVVECLAAAVPQFEEKKMAVIPELPFPVTVTADREKTIRIVQNLVRNCLQHSDGDVTVEISQNGDEARVIFSNPVRHPENVRIESLFDRFYTADRSRRSTGLGLSIVRLLAEQMGGRVSARLDGHTISIGVCLPAENANA